MPREDGTIYTDDWNWADAPELPTLDRSGIPMTDPPFGGRGSAAGAYNPMNYYTPWQRLAPPTYEITPGQFATPYTQTSGLTRPAAEGETGSPILTQIAGLAQGLMSQVINSPLRAAANVVANSPLNPFVAASYLRSDRLPSGGGGSSGFPYAPTGEGTEAYLGEQDVYRGKPLTFIGGGAGSTGSGLGVGGGAGAVVSGGAGGGAGYSDRRSTDLWSDNARSGMSPDELRWKNVAEKLGLNWQVTKDVYMNPARNGSPSPAAAIGRQLDDKIWGDAFLQAVGRAPNEVEWVDHYNAVHFGGRDPLDGHPYAQQAIRDMQQRIEQETADPYPDWYKVRPPVTV